MRKSRIVPRWVGVFERGVEASSFWKLLSFWSDALKAYAGSRNDENDEANRIEYPGFEFLSFEVLEDRSMVDWDETY